VRSPLPFRSSFCSSIRFGARRALRQVSTYADEELLHASELEQKTLTGRKARGYNATLHCWKLIVLIQNRKYVWELYALALGLLIVWNYWLPVVAVTSPFAYNLANGDFVIYRRAGELWLAHQNPYMLNGATTNFVYPPTSLPLYGLFSLIDFKLSGELWTLLYMFVFATSFLALSRTLDGYRKRLYTLTSILLFITSYPIILLIQDGQCELLIAGAAILGLALQRMKHSFSSAFSLSVATLLKGPAVLLLIYFVLFRRDARYFIYFVASTLSLAVASLLIVPIDLYWYYLVKVLPSLSVAASQGVFIVTEPTAQSIVKYLAVAGFTGITPIVSIVGFIVFGVFSFWVSSRRPRPIGKRPIFCDAMFLMNVLVMLEFVPRTETYSYVWVILPLALCLSALLMENVNAYYAALFALVTFMLNSSFKLQLYGSRSLPIVETPFEIIGNLVLILALAVIYLKPTLAMTYSPRIMKAKTGSYTRTRSAR